MLFGRWAEWAHCQSLISCLLRLLWSCGVACKSPSLILCFSLEVEPWKVNSHFIRVRGEKYGTDPNSIKNRQKKVELKPESVKTGSEALEAEHRSVCVES